MQDDFDPVPQVSATIKACEELTDAMTWYADDARSKGDLVGAAAISENIRNHQIWGMLAQAHVALARGAHDNPYC